MKSLAEFTDPHAAAIDGEHDVWNPHTPNLAALQQLGGEALKPVLSAPVFLEPVVDLKLLPPPDVLTWQNAPAPNPADRRDTIPAPARHRANSPVDTIRQRPYGN